jgi:folate-binding protein YgfZ
LISLSGPDAPKFLQGLVTKNIDPEQSEPVYSAFLDARGRVLWDIFIWRWPTQNSEEWSCYLEVDSREVDSCLKHLKKHKLRSKIKLEAVPEGNVSVWSCWGVGVTDLPPAPIIASLTDPRAPGFGTRFLIQEQGIPGEGKIDIVDTQQYHLRRYLYGIPEGQREIQRESALPMECNIDLSEGIDFRKGCYVGQELTIRTKHTGVVRKRILPVQLYHPDSPAPQEDGAPCYDPNWKGEVAEGTDIKQLAEEGSIKKGRATGKFISGIGNVGLAMCRLEMMTPMRVSAEGGTYKRGAEFGLQISDEEGEKPMRIKAFVPQWLKERESQVWDKGRQRHVQ